MKKYITHKRYKGKAISTDYVNLPYGTKLIELEGFLVTENGEVVASARSDIAKRHFAINEDGRGLERGKLTYLIAYAKNKQGFRFSDKQIQFLEKKYSKFLQKNQLALLFNDEFFLASVEELEKMVSELRQRS